MLKLAIRVSSNSSSGRGHIERCLAIRKYLPEKVFWFVDSDSKYIKNKIFKSDKIFYENGKHKFNILKNSLKKYFINCILIDNYNIDSKDIYNISDDIPIIVFVDQNTNIKADMLICSQPIDLDYTQGKKYLVGPKYAPISEKFNFVKKDIKKKKNILISFGAYDSAGVTLNVIKSIKDFIESGSYNLNIIITLTNESPIISHVKYEIKNLSNFKLVLDCKKMEDIYKDCGIALGAPGLSHLERMASGIPSILISQNKLHSSLIDKWVKLGCGVKAESTLESIQDKLKLFLLNDDFREKIIINGRNLIDGKGAHRIATEIIKMVNKR